MVNEQFELYLIRHGVAAERGDNYPDDTKRPLTSDGIQKLKREGKALVALDLTFDVILTSPLARTRQTAETIAAVYRTPPSIVNVQALAPGGTHNAIIEELSKHPRRHKIADRRPRAWDWRAGFTIGWSAKAARVQEGRNLPHRRRGTASGWSRSAPVVSVAEDAAEDREVAYATVSGLMCPPLGTMMMPLRM